MELQEMEAKVIPYLISGKPIAQIAGSIDIPIPKVKYIAKKLVGNGVLVRAGYGKYELGISSYTVAKEEKLRKIRPFTNPVIVIPASTEHYIRLRYKEVPRTRIAQELGIGKLELNMMIIQLRIKGSG